MEFKKIIFVITGLLFFLSAPAAVGWFPPVPDMPSERIKSIHSFKLSRPSIVVAENEPDAAESGGRPASENKDPAPDSGTADSQKSGRDSLIFARPGDRQESQKKTDALLECNKSLKQARYHLDIELPEQARKQNVPPGWLRCSRSTPRRLRCTHLR